MRNLAIGVAGVLAALLLAGTAVAGTTYAGPKQWWPNEGAGSAYSSGWHYNYFFKENGLDATVTFIDNVSYSWHGTVRGTSSTIYARWYVSNVKRGHCFSHSGYRWGSCYVTD